MTRQFELPLAVRQRTASAGEAGRRWLEALPALVASLERDFGVTVGEVLHGGSAALVAEAVTAGGEAVVLKVGSPAYDAFADEVAVLQIAAGRGYATLLRYDEARRAVLLERLGPQLSELAYSADRQIEVFCQTLRDAWVVPPDPARFQTGAQKARFLAESIAAWHVQLGRPCSQAVVDQALAFAAERAAAFDPATSVMLHGDGHASNILQRLDGAGFKFIDPDPFFGERAHDLAIPLRWWDDDAAPGDPAARAISRCQRFAALAGQPALAIWQWAFTERVSSGLYMLTLGMPDGRQMLSVAERWVGVKP